VVQPGRPGGIVALGIFCNEARNYKPSRLFLVRGIYNPYTCSLKGLLVFDLVVQAAPHERRRYSQPRLRLECSTLNARQARALRQHGEYVPDDHLPETSKRYNGRHATLPRPPSKYIPLDIAAWILEPLMHTEYPSEATEGPFT
jgi:hypothetical protein